MIVRKTLEVLDKLSEWDGNNIFVLGNRVLIESTPIMKLNGLEVIQMSKLLSRNNNVTFSNSWIDYMKKGVENSIKYLNQTHYYKYEDRGWSFLEYEDKYIVTVFLDNYDVEEFVVFEIPVNEINKKELLKYADEERR